MAPARSTPETCAYCDAAVDGERSYRRHLREAHDRSELGRIDRRRADRARSKAVETADAVAASLRALRYPVDGETALRYVAYGALASLSVAAALGVGT